MRSGKARPLGQSKYGLWLVLHNSILTNWWHVVLSGCVRFCVWKLLFGGLIDRADKYVEHAIWAEAEDV